MAAGITALGWAAIAATAVTAYNGYQQQQAAGKAAKQADAAAKQQEEANNRANAKKADVNALLSAAQQSSKTGPSGTMLTGPSGIDPSALSLGKNTLLGQ